MQEVRHGQKVIGRSRAHSSTLENEFAIAPLSLVSAYVAGIDMGDPNDVMLCTYVVM